MNREQKVEVAESLAQRLQGTPLVVLADYRGVNVERINAFRRAMESAGIEYRVVKNTLVRRVVEGTDKEGLEALLVGMTGVIIAGEDPVAAAKAVRDATKDLKKEEKFTLKGGWFDGEVFKGEDIIKVADLPSREELLGTLLATLQEGPRQLLGVLQAPARDLLYLLKNHEAQLETQGAG